jgi:uncharacterized protein YaaN involved in tellurite resistance
MKFPAWLFPPAKPAQPDPTAAALGRIEWALAQLGTRGTNIMAAIDNLTAAVARLSTDLSTENNLLDHLAQTARDLAAQLAASSAASQDPAIQAAADQLTQLAATAEARVAADGPVAVAPASPPPQSPPAP